MQTVDLILYPDAIVPVRPRHTVLEGHALVIDSGRIEAMIPSAEVAKRFEARKQVDLRGHTLFPGFVNIHTHAGMNLLRGIADDQPLMTWLQDHIWPTEGEFVSADFVRLGTRLAIAEMLRCGTTCFNDQYFFPDAVAQEAASAGIRANVAMLVIEFPTAWAKDANEYFERGEALHNDWGDHALVRTCWAPHAPYTVSDDSFKRIAERSRDMNVPIHVHVHETADEVNDGLRDHRERPFARLDRLGVVNERLLAVHMTQLIDEEVQRCADAGTHVLHCPESNLKLASGMAPIADLLSAGVNVALGTDGAASNNDLDMIGEMRTAALIGKVRAGRADAVSAFEALELATINGARALGRDAEIGSLEVGKAADCFAIRSDDITATPHYDRISHLVYAAHRGQVSHTWVGGRPLLDHGSLTTLDEIALRETGLRWQHKIREHNHG